MSLVPQPAAMLGLTPISALQIISASTQATAHSGFGVDASVDTRCRRHSSRRRSSAAVAMTPWPKPSKTLQPTPANACEIINGIIATTSLHSSTCRCSRRSLMQSLRPPETRQPNYCDDIFTAAGQGTTAGATRRPQEHQRKHWRRCSPEARNRCAG
jgi:hypothetical protein